MGGGEVEIKWRGGYLFLYINAKDWGDVFLSSFKRKR